MVRKSDKTYSKDNLRKEAKTGKLASRTSAASGASTKVSRDSSSGQFVDVRGEKKPAASTVSKRVIKRSSSDNEEALKRLVNR